MISTVLSLTQQIKNLANNLLIQTLQKNKESTELIQLGREIKNQCVRNSIDIFKKLRDNTKQEIFMERMKLNKKQYVFKISSNIDNLIFYQNLYKSIPIRIVNLDSFSGQRITLKIRLFLSSGNELQKTKYQLKNNILINQEQSEYYIQIKISQITSKLQNNYLSLIIQVDQSSPYKEIIQPLVFPQIVVLAKKITRNHYKTQHSIDLLDQDPNSATEKKGVINLTKKVCKIKTRKGRSLKNKI